jgi:2-phospho-L-lactate transferase/gluconeogenesis factor (CofD/UPF0052 family)
MDQLAIRRLLNYRLPDDCERARHEWHDLVEGRHDLWDNVPSELREVIRPYLNFLNGELVTRIRPTSSFNFSRASIGNMFLTGARLFSGSLEAAIELLKLICHVPRRTKVLPTLNTLFTHHISAGLENGNIITGQNAISHPSEPTAVPDPLSLSAMNQQDAIVHEQDHDAREDANLPGTLPSLRRQNIAFSKEHETPLPARIKRVWYINPYGQEIRLVANLKVTETIRQSQCIIYSIGSLFTSIVPSLILKGVGEAIISSKFIKSKVLILNGCLDRETGPPESAFSATDFVAAIAQACWDSLGRQAEKTVPRAEYKRFVTHVLYLQGKGTPAVDRTELSSLGIETQFVFGRLVEEGAQYDLPALGQALSSLVSTKNSREKSRRNTIVQ